MSTWTWSYLIWGARWLLVGFLAFELVAKDITGIAPWMSLTATGRHAISTYPAVGPLLFATIVFLAVHFIYARGVVQSALFGLAVALLAHWLDRRL